MIGAPDFAGVRPPREPAMGLLHPVAWISLVVLVLNDHWLKHVYPSLLSGKLSDFAGLALTPLVLQAGYERLGAALRGKPPSPESANRALGVSVVATLLGFTLVELWGPAERAYSVGWALLQWPPRALWSLVWGAGTPGLAPVTATADVTDLVALPMGLVALVVGWQGEPKPAVSRQRDLRRRWLGGALAVLLGGFGWVPTARAQALETGKHDERGGYTHDGFYAAAELGMGPLFLDSRASISNGFRQAIPSSARGVVVPALGLAVGGTLPGGLVLGARALLSDSPEPVIDTLGRSFYARDMRIRIRDLALFAEYYPDVYGGLHFGGSLGILQIGVDHTRDVLGDSRFPDSEEQTGVSLALDGGYCLWLGRQLSLGARARLLAGRAMGDHGATLLLAPLLTVSVSWH